MTDAVKSDSPPLPPIPDSGDHGAPSPHLQSLPVRPRASEGEDKGDLAPGTDRALDDIKKGSR